MVELTREKVAAGRDFATLEEWQAAWEEWLPMRRAQVHRTHGEVIAVRAEARPRRPAAPARRALRGLASATCAWSARTRWSPSRPRSTRCPGRDVRPRQRLELRVTPEEVRDLEPGGRAAAAGHAIPAPASAAAGSWTSATGTGSRTGAARTPAPPRRCPSRSPTTCSPACSCASPPPSVAVARRDIASLRRALRRACRRCAMSELVSETHP